MPWPVQPQHLLMTIVRKEDTCGVFLPEGRGTAWQQMGTWEKERVPVRPLRQHLHKRVKTEPSL